MLLPLGLSTAFDTVSHDIPLKRLKTKHSIIGTALQWFCSSLTDCKLP